MWSWVGGVQAHELVPINPRRRQGPRPGGNQRGGEGDTGPFLSRGCRLHAGGVSGNGAWDLSSSRGRSASSLAVAKVLFWGCLGAWLNGGFGGGALCPTAALAQPGRLSPESQAQRGRGTGARPVTSRPLGKPGVGPSCAAPCTMLQGYAKASLPPEAVGRGAGLIPFLPRAV